MVRFYVTNHQLDQNAYASTLTNAYSRQTNRSTNTCLFDRVSDESIPDFTSKSTVYTAKMLTTAEQRSGVLATLQHDLERARAFLQRAQKRFKRDFNQRLRKGFEWISTGDYVFDVVLDGVIKTSKFERPDERPYRVLGHD